MKSHQYTETQRKAGFTLLELLVVMVIITIMTGLAVPRLSGSISSMHLKTAARKIAASLRYARSQAVSEKITYLSVFDFKNRRLINKPFISGNDSEMLPSFSTLIKNQQEPSAEIQKIYDFPEGISLVKAISNQEDIKSGMFQIAFYPGGNSSGGELIIADNKEIPYRIHVDFITGTVQVKDEANP